MIIVVAWSAEGQEVAKLGRVDIGEHHEFRSVRVPHACVWKNDATDDDLEKAQALAQKQGWTVYTFVDSCEDPLGEARKAITKDTPIEAKPERKVKVKVKVCGKCRGNGTRGRKYKSTCFACNGSGEVTCK